MIYFQNTEDPNVISSQLSCLSALTVFLPQAKDTGVLRDVLKKVNLKKTILL